jgi:hypothetical protein
MKHPAVLDHRINQLLLIHSRLRHSLQLVNTATRRAAKASFDLQVFIHTHYHHNSISCDDEGDNK